MRLLSLNVGLPREVDWKGRRVTTGIFKEPVQGRLMLRALNLDGDRQADLTVHGGTHKAVYAYSAAHYDYWRRELPGRELPFGMFGENLTIDDFPEAAVNVGDRFRLGTAELVVSQPRLPCYKLGIKFGRDDMVDRFLASGRTGVYFSVAREGDVGPGDELTLVDRDAGQVSVPEVTRLYLSTRYGPAEAESARRAIRVEALPESWRRYFRERLQEFELGIPLA